MGRASVFESRGCNSYARGRAIKPKKTTPVFLITLALLHFWLLPSVQAVSPPPDGGYAGDNTAQGTSALSSLTTGILNTANGANALVFNTTGGFNTANGSGALRDNRTGIQNTANGSTALLKNTTGNFNTATGIFALLNNTTGGGNVALGFEAGLNATTGSGNVYIGTGMQGVAAESNACY